MGNHELHGAEGSLDLKKIITANGAIVVLEILN